MPTTMRALVLALLLLGVSSTTTADEVQDRRDHAGVRLFRSLLAADLDLPKKTVAANQLLILFLYVDDAKHANDLAKSFVEESKERDKLRGLSIVIEPTNDITFAKYATRVPAGIFIADAPNKASLASIVRYGIAHRVIVYSPYEGHVESGVLGGLSVEAQVRPFVNRSTLEASQITLKSFFLEVAKVYR